MVDESLIEKIPALEIETGKTYNVLSLEGAYRDTFRDFEKVPDKLLYSTVTCLFTFENYSYVEAFGFFEDSYCFEIPNKNLGIIHYLNRPLN